MTDFDFDVLQKKRTASGARHRKNGSKSKRCSLPSDNLTEAQKRKLNGPVYTLKMEPMTWSELMKLPDTLRKEYLSELVKTYEASQRMMADMLGMSQSTVRNELNRLGVRSGKSGGRGSRGDIYDRRKAAWAAFCNGVVGGGSKPEEAVREPRVWDLVEGTCPAEEAPQEAAGEPIYEEVEWPGDELNVPENEAVEEDAGFEDAYSTEPGLMTALSAEYKGDAAYVSQLMTNMMAMFGTAKVKVKLSVEVMP